MKTTILWFRRDLRLLDNAALNWACEHSDTIIPVYIHSIEEEQPWAPGSASRWWLHNSLVQLEKDLKRHGSKLYFFSGDSSETITRIMRETGAENLVFNKLYEQHLYNRDTALQRKLGEKLNIASFDSGLLFKPDTVLNNQQLPYRVFTPFYKKTRPLLNQAYANYAITSPPEKLKPSTDVKLSFSQTLQSLQLLDEHPWHEKLHNHWQPGEDRALALMDSFLEQGIKNYDSNRDIPACEGTSRLSPYLHFGEITPQQIYIALWPLLEGVEGAQTTLPAEVFLKQLFWREFAQHVLWHFPHTAIEPMDKRYKKSFWRSDKKAFKAWTQGGTGIAMVDAGMQQLWQTGWMHNRVRMIAGSFLTKNLGINWKQGADWFWDTLVDADLANNSMGWQWVAGCGVDAAPYYRIFNPERQAQRFDATLQYINRWRPEHDESDYPAPIVDLAVSREQALQRYRRTIT